MTYILGFWFPLEAEGWLYGESFTSVYACFTDVGTQILAAFYDSL